MTRLHDPRFSSGPTKKPEAWKIEDLAAALVGRSHRSEAGLGRLQELTQRLRQVLEIPNSHEIALMAGSCTGAMEAAFWNLLGNRDVDVLAWDIFGRMWVRDIRDELNLKGNTLLGNPGELPDLKGVHWDHDVVFTWNGSTAGVRIPHGDWIPEDRRGLTLCDAVSAAFAYDLPWDKLDVTAFALQKGLGGEAGLGVLVFGPRAFERLETYKPAWGVPRLFRLRDQDTVFTHVFEGKTLNTPSLLTVEDGILCLKIAEQMGGLPALVKRSEENLQIVEDWIGGQDHFKFLAPDPASRSHTTICLTLKGVTTWDPYEKIAKDLAQRGIAFDIRGHIREFPCLRLWGGPMVEPADIKALLEGFA